MQHHPNTLRLRELMEQYGVSVEDVGELLSRSPGTIYQYRGARKQPIPSQLLELLELKLQLRANQVHRAPETA